MTDDPPVPVPPIEFPRVRFSFACNEEYIKFHARILMHQCRRGRGGEGEEMVKAGKDSDKQEKEMEGSRGEEGVCISSFSCFLTIFLSDTHKASVHAFGERQKGCERQRQREEASSEGQVAEKQSTHKPEKTRGMHAHAKLSYQGDPQRFRERNDYMTQQPE